MNKLGWFSKHSQILWIQLKNNFVREAIYRTNFLSALATDLIWIGVEFGLFAVIYSNTPTLVGWTQPQVYFFLGIFFSSDALFTVFFQRNFWLFSDLVSHGELDLILTKPASTVFLALSRWMNLSAILNFILGIAIAVRFAPSAGFAGGAHWLLLLFWLPVGVFSAVLLRFAFVVWVFWTDRGFALSRLYYQFFSIATKPDPIYPSIIRVLILTALPFAFICSVPTRALLNGLRAEEYFLVAGVLTAFCFFNAWMWRLGLRRYQSASS